MHDQPAAVEDGKVRNTADVVSGRKLGIFLRVHLDDDGVTRHFRGRANHLWRGHPAGSTPFCPEIDQHRNPRILRDFVELFGINFQRFVHRRQRRLASPRSGQYAPGVLPAPGSSVRRLCSFAPSPFSAFLIRHQTPTSLTQPSDAWTFTEDRARVRGPTSEVRRSTFKVRLSLGSGV